MKYRTEAERKAARRASIKAWRRRNVEKVRAGQKRSRERHREVNLVRLRAYSLKSRFGMTVEEYEKMLAAQGGGCAICGAAPEGKRHAVDHCHDSKKVRGLLCAHCNLILGHAKDSTETLRRAIAYLEAK